MSNDEQFARIVIHELRSFRSRIEEILGVLAEKRVISRAEREALQALLTSLKSDLRRSAKQGTVVPGEPQNRFERAYFAPAMQSAAANLGVAVNSHPIRSDWFSCLYGVQMDIGLLLHQLEEQFTEV